MPHQVVHDERQSICVTLQPAPPGGVLDRKNPRKFGFKDASGPHWAIFYAKHCAKMQLTAGLIPTRINVREKIRIGFCAPTEPSLLAIPHNLTRLLISVKHRKLEQTRGVTVAKTDVVSVRSDGTHRVDCQRLGLRST